MVYTCIVVDDEPLARKGIQLHIKEIPSLKQIGEFSNAVQAGEFLQNNDVDIMFLDIQMPGLTGIDFVRNMNVQPAIIFTTAYTEYAIDAFDLNVVDYLLKPIKFDRFYKAAIKAQEFIKLRNEGASDFEDFTQEYVYIKSDRKYIRLYYTDVLFIQGMKDYVMIHTLTQKYMTAMNIKTILAQLPETTFARVSKSYIINIDKIDSIDIDMVYIGEHDIPVGNAYKKDFLNTHINERLLKR